ncbi:XK-related protein 5 [Salmo salar]|uniref:XK-related protein n=1 Tax=Salmo salar TaxID=8030 RepID=A0A1S3RI54_SALSA|nr:XK-related protein 5-like [Salmo salar]|eukprot:XP_014052000.1 PREDICTED: XK-related protein 5-like [Salmo salar]
MRQYTTSRERGGSCVACCQVCVFAFTAFLIVAERTALIYCFVYYLWVGHNYCYGHWAGLTALFLLPGWGPQLLSWLWYQADGRICSKDLKWTHILHLGIFRRLWETMTSTGVDRCSEIMQQADVSALRLLEALVVTLPQTVLQTYVLICTDVGLSSPVSVCFAVCLLSLAWALVLYARACSLIRPGHLPMTPAAIACRLLWRVSMLGARLATLTLFTRLFRQWVLGVIGLHWLGATFWLVSQQSDIIKTPLRWRLFNLVLGAVHIFLFLNVKDGASRCRMAGFYLAMFIENALLLLAGSDFFSVASWDSMGIPAAVFCSFLIGVIALVLYYRFLHPKSFEIFQSIRHHGMGGACADRGSSLSLEEKSHRHGQLVGGGNLLELPSQWQGWKHHHWLLIRLAMKTGDVARISHAYGEGGLVGLLGLEEETLPRSPDIPQRSLNVPQDPPIVPQSSPIVPQVDQVRQVEEVIKAAPARDIISEVRQAVRQGEVRHVLPSPSPIQEVNPPLVEVLVEEVRGHLSEPSNLQDNSSPPHSSPPPSEERDDEDFQSATYCSPTPSSPKYPDYRHIDSNVVTSNTEGSSSAGSLDVRRDSSPERSPSLLLGMGSPQRNFNPTESGTALYFSTDAVSPSSGSYLGWGSELSPISTYRSPYRIREPLFTSTPRQEPRAVPEEPGPSPSTTATTTMHARKQLVQFVDHREKLI